MYSSKSKIKLIRNQRNIPLTGLIGTEVIFSRSCHHVTTGADNKELFAGSPVTWNITTADLERKLEMESLVFHKTGK